MELMSRIYYLFQYSILQPDQVIDTLDIFQLCYVYYAMLCYVTMVTIAHKMLHNPLVLAGLSTIGISVHIISQSWHSCSLNKGGLSTISYIFKVSVKLSEKNH